MTSIFADSFYFFALLNPRDPYHAKAVAFSQTFVGKGITEALTGDHHFEQAGFVALLK